MADRMTQGWGPADEQQARMEEAIHPCTCLSADETRGEECERHGSALSAADPGEGAFCRCGPHPPWHRNCSECGKPVSATDPGEGAVSGEALREQIVAAILSVSQGTRSSTLSGDLLRGTSGHIIKPGAAADAILRLPLLTAERERAEDAEWRHREKVLTDALGDAERHRMTAIRERDEARERADRLVGNASASDLRDVGNWLVREADQRVRFFPQRRDGVDALMRSLSALLTEAALSATDPGRGDEVEAATRQAEHRERIVDAALSATDPEADQPCAECGVEKRRHDSVDGCSGFVALKPPSATDPGEQHRPRNASGRCTCGEWNCPRMSRSATDPDEKQLQPGDDPGSAYGWRTTAPYGPPPPGPLYTDGTNEP